MHRPATGPHSNLADLAGVGHVLTDPDAMAPALRDWRGVHVGQARAVVRPGNTDEVAALVRWANQTGTPLVPQGGNTGLCGGATPDGSGNAVVVCLGRMDRIRDLDPLDGVAVVEAGCILANLHQAAAGHGLMFPLGLGSEGTCQIGGLISTNAGGVEVLRHGPMRSQVLGLEVVLPDGRVLNGLRRLRKDNTGYDVKHLFIGAEGTLGIVTAAALQLVPLPGATATALCGLQSPDDALRLLAALRARAWGRLAKFEIACAGEVGLARAHLPGLRWPLAAPHAWYVITELADADPAAPLAALLTDALAAALESGIVADAAVAQNMAQEAEFWRVRHTIPEANRRAGPTVSHDVAVPVSRVPEMLRRLDAPLAALEPGARPAVCWPSRRREHPRGVAVPHPAAGPRRHGHPRAPRGVRRGARPGRQHQRRTRGRPGAARPAAGLSGPGAAGSDAGDQGAAGPDGVDESRKGRARSSCGRSAECKRLRSWLPPPSRGSVGERVRHARNPVRAWRTLSFPHRFAVRAPSSPWKGEDKLTLLPSSLIRCNPN